MTIKEFFGKLTSRYLWGHLLAMVIVVVVAVIGLAIWLNQVTHHGEAIEIPDLTGMTTEKARTLLEADGLGLEVTDSGYNKRMPADCVLSQVPSAGKKVKAGRTIYVVVNSLHSPQLIMPDVICNGSSREGQAKLRAMGFKLTDPVMVEGEEWIIKVVAAGREVHAGDRVSIESPLTLYIGRGNSEDDDEYFVDSLMTADDEEFNLDGEISE